VESYKLMLDFYGICLVNETTGEVDYAPDFEDRFKNLNRFLLSCLSFLLNFIDVVSILLGSGQRFFFDFSDIHTITCASHAY